MCLADPPSKKKVHWKILTCFFYSFNPLEDMCLFCSVYYKGPILFIKTPRYYCLNICQLSKYIYLVSKDWMKMRIKNE